MNEKIKQTISLISDKLAQLQDPYWLIGSSALVLAGIQLEAIDDVDLLTSNRDADWLKQQWVTKKLNDYLPANADKFLSNFGRYKWGELMVEVMGELKVYQNGEWVPLKIENWEEIEIEGLKLKIPTLLEQYRIFKLFGRDKDLKKANLIIEQTKYSTI
ncbi:hypothetical protein Emtol_0743 [Emticicia oligotrophica DSM 17448]|uniref:Nucleotidyltransferase family protein n=1 Tax=Emticicia oligotrophica (strain DSM 17448 / CIP 109782 / MTCC 6937 / GPTSA100-15) TaxID=929562 RepID=A0ABM5MY81_EMTOG|nr:hypothetical protein [Emticicia oligotrophica]AFK01895.1 hypothetical protein Emtol_0743 [Emticicia oligotrophica DSM 17448]